MLKRWVGMAVLVAGFAGAAAAQSVGTTPEECFKATVDLAKEAESKKLPDAKLATIEELLTKLETSCEAKNFTEAAKVVADVKAAIGSP